MLELAVICLGGLLVTLMGLLVIVIITGPRR